MSEAEVSQFLCVLIKMGEALQNSGAEVFRVEDTLNRIAAAYGAEEVNIFVITSSIVVTLTMPDLPPQTQTRRLRKSTGNDLLELEQLNALSRRICAEKPPVEEFQQQLSTILAQPGEPRLHLAGSVLAAASFAVFFGGSLWDGVLAGGVAVFICWMERWLGPVLPERRSVPVHCVVSQRHGCSAVLPGLPAAPCGHGAHRRHHAAGARHSVYQRHPGYPAG